MTKSELIDLMAEKSDLTKARAELVVNCIFESMAEALLRGEGIEIRGFGSFTVTVQSVSGTKSAHRCAGFGAAETPAVFPRRQRIERARQREPRKIRHHGRRRSG